MIHKDDQHIIYVNSKYRGNDALGKLMSDFWCCDPDQMNYQIIADQVRKYKEIKENDMGKLLDEMREAAIKEGHLEGQREGRREGRRLERRIQKRKNEQYKMKMVRKMIDGHQLSYDEIADYYGLPVEKIKNMAAAQ